MKPEGRVVEFRSPVDGLLHPYAICATDDSPEPTPLILDVSPGAIADLAASVAVTEKIVAVAAAAGLRCVALRPTGRGPGTVYQDYGAVDTFEAIDHVRSLYAIDADAVSLSGFSMGGAATWYLLSHYPDAFAAGAPFCGYADYRLWEKPGGGTFPMRPWEEASWVARSAAFLLANLDRTPLWVVHGEWDRAVGGGVSVEQSRRMVRALEARGAQVRYTEVPGVGHDLDRSGIWEDVIRWLLRQRRAPDPDRVSFVTATLRHNASRWVRIDQLRRYPTPDAIAAGVGSVDAEVGADGVVRVRTHNVETLTLGPKQGGRDVTSIELDGSRLGRVDLSAPRTWTGAKGRWVPLGGDLASQKQHGSSGPIGDLFWERTILVPGTMGGAEATFFNAWVAREAAAFYRTRNGGVHRGGIMGVNTVDLPAISDVDLNAEERATANLLCYGTPATNAVLRAFADRLPIVVGPDWLRLGDREWHDPRVSAFAVFPHPQNASRYVAMHGGPAPDAVTWGSHLHMALLPDYLVYAGGETLEWGFWGNDWRSQEATR